MLQKNYHKYSSIILTRASVLGIMMILIFAIIIVRMFYLQIISYESFFKLSEKNRTLSKTIVPQRGAILDRNGIVLAKNIEKPILQMIVSPSIKENQDTIRRLNELFTIDTTLLEGLKPKQEITLKYLNSDEELVFLLHQEKFPNVSMKNNIERDYPFKDISSHIVGYMGNSDDAEPREIYSLLPTIGKSGVEFYYEKELRGEIGKNIVETNVSGDELAHLGLVETKNGTDITTTIDIRLQAFAYELIQKKKFKGSVVVVEPATGEILAAVSYPSFDPNLFNSSSESEKLKALLSQEDNPLFNRFVSGKYPPASTIKPFIGLAALDELGSRYTIYDKGYFITEFDKKIFRNWQKKGAGYVNLHKAIVKSNNTYFYTISDKLGIDKLKPALSDFGFGQKTVEDIPNQSVGVLPDPKWKMEMFGEIWLPGDTINLSIGQGYLSANPLQLAFATNILANRGKKIMLRINKNLQNSTTSFVSNDVTDFQPLIRAMEQVFHSKEGTAYKTAKTILDNSYKVAGKTGTAQVVTAIRDEYGRIKVKPIKNDNALFIGFAPSDNPRIAVVVVLENAGAGGLEATPVGLNVIDFYLKNLL